MTVPFLRAYALHVIHICHRRGAYAMGGMAAQIPIRNDPEANAAALAKVRADKEREAADGHDGTWVAHPGLVPIALEAFERTARGPNQLDRRARSALTPLRERAALRARGTITEAGVRSNLEVGVRYVEAWLGGLGCVPIHHLMEDAATSEISRTQLWQWLHFGAKLDDGRPITVELYESGWARSWPSCAPRSAGALPSGHFRRRDRALPRHGQAPKLEEFLTLPAYELLP